MKNTTRISIMTGLAVLFFLLFSCKTSSIVDYQNMEKKLFMNNKVPVSQLAEYAVDDGYFFLALNNTWESYLVVFTIFYAGNELPNFNISNISIADESGNVVFFYSNIDLSALKITKADEMYRNNYHSYGASLNEKIALASLDKNKYFVSFEISGTKINQILERKKRAYVNMR